MDELLKTPSGDKWRRIGTEKRAGVLVPLFLVYSKKSLGIGDFEDMELVIDWCEKSGNSILQLLPMNEFGPTSCPYDTISSFALEPSYISLNSLDLTRTIKTKITEIRKRFPAGEVHVDYGIKEAKIDLLWQIYSGSDSRTSKEFRKFVEDNKYWLDDFALFKTLKAYHGGLPWYEWEEGYKGHDATKLMFFRDANNDDILFQKWLQWVAFNQFREAKSYAISKNILIKGDLPILISRDSADVWAHPGFFKLEFAAGAPPDMYCAKGQRWGVPTYNWKAIEDDGYKYLKAKLKFAEHFYDILRIDHVVGLFRIWSIPYNDPPENEGLNGVFDPKDEKEWERHGRALLSVMLESTDMLLASEDLGMIPKDCPETLKEFGIPGNDVQRWTKDWNTRHDFLKPAEYRLLSVAMLSTHDTTNWSAWWENEAGTVDEALFMRKCVDRGIDFLRVKDELFSSELSRHGRLRWRDDVKSSEILTGILGKPKEELKDFIELYENSYREKEKLWKHLGLKGGMREESDPEILAAALNITMKSRSVFSINLIIDYLNLDGIFEGDPYKYRINRPGTVSADNWSLTVPVPLEELLRHRVSEDVKKAIASGSRA